MRRIRYTNYLDQEEYIHALDNLLRDIGSNYSFLWENNSDLALRAGYTPQIPKKGVSFADSDMTSEDWCSFSIDIVKKDEKFCYAVKNNKKEIFYLDGAGVYRLMNQFRYSFDSENGMKEIVQEVRKNILHFFKKDFLEKESVLQGDFNAKKSNLESKIKLDLS